MKASKLELSPKPEPKVDGKQQPITGIGMRPMTRKPHAVAACRHVVHAIAKAIALSSRRQHRIWSVEITDADHPRLDARPCTAGSRDGSRPLARDDDH